MFRYRTPETILLEIKVDNLGYARLRIVTPCKRRFPCFMFRSIVLSPYVGCETSNIHQHPLFLRICMEALKKSLTV